MIRFLYVIITKLFSIFYYIPRMKYCANHPEKFDEITCYQLANEVIDKVSERARVTNIVYGIENIPKEGGYVIYANHQGKYDALAIIKGHEKPCTMLIDANRAKIPVLCQLVDLLHGLRLQRGDIKQQVGVMAQAVELVKQGKKLLIFPEGVYSDNHNTIQEFRPGSFKIPLRAKCSILPVTLIDTYKPFGENSLKKVNTYAYFLEAIPYEDFCNMKTTELSQLVHNRIQSKINEVCRENEKEQRT